MRIVHRLLQILSVVFALWEYLLKTSGEKLSKSRKRSYSRNIYFPHWPVYEREKWRPATPPSEYAHPLHLKKEWVERISLTMLFPCCWLAALRLAHFLFRPLFWHLFYRLSAHVSQAADPNFAKWRTCQRSWRLVRGEEAISLPSKWYMSVSSFPLLFNHCSLSKMFPSPLYMAHIPWVFYDCLLFPLRSCPWLIAVCILFSSPSLYLLFLSSFTFWYAFTFRSWQNFAPRVDRLCPPCRTLCSHQSVILHPPATPLCTAALPLASYFAPTSTRRPPALLFLLSLAPLFFSHSILRIFLIRYRSSESEIREIAQFGLNTRKGESEEWRKEGEISKSTDV
jgi:hypothetical protein